MNLKASTFCGSSRERQFSQVPIYIQGKYHHIHLFLYPFAKFIVTVALLRSHSRNVFIAHEVGSTIKCAVTFV